MWCFRISVRSAVTTNRTMGCPFFKAVKLVRTYVVLLIEAYESQLHKRLPSRLAWSKGRSVFYEAAAVADFWATAFFFPPAFRKAAQRLRVASMIALRPAELSLRFLGAAGLAALLPCA